MYVNVCHLCVGGRILGLGVGQCGRNECGSVRTCALLLTVTAIMQKGTVYVRICILHTCMVPH